MKKYKLKIKNDSAKYRNYGLNINHDVGGGYVWLVDEQHPTYDHNSLEEHASVFDEEDICKLPYGFIRQYDLIELEKDLYNIICPYTNDILTCSKGGNGHHWDRSDCKTDGTLYKRLFTLDEIEDEFPLLLDWAEKY